MNSQFTNYFTARKEAMNSLYWSLDEMLSSMSLFKAAMLGTGIALAGAAFQLYPIKANSTTNIVEKVANSAQFADQEELCIFRGTKGQVNPEMICSPHFDKGRKPGGKLITARLSPVHVPKLTIGQYDPDISVDEGVHVEAPDEVYPIVSQDIAGRYLGIPPFPSQAPDNLREARFESAQIDEARKLKLAPKLKLKATPAPVARKVAPHQRCKARSYWSEKHGECRRKR